MLHVVFYLMATVTKNSSLKYYPLKRIDKAVIDAFEKHTELAVTGVLKTRIGTTLKLFECFCDITNTDINYTLLSSNKFNTITEEFVGALASGELIDQTVISTNQIIKIFLETLSSLKSDIPSMSPPQWSTSLPKTFAPKWNDVKKHLDGDACLYWSGWIATSRDGQDIPLRIPELWNSHGKEFACMVHKAYDLHFQKLSRPLNTLPNQMLGYISTNSDKWPAGTFQHPVKIEEFFKSFLRDYFLDCHNRGLDIDGQIKTWGTFINNIHQAFIDTGHWVTPFSHSLPRPSSKKVVSGAKTNIKKKKNGSTVNTKLMTEIPLQCSDEQAINLLFTKVKQDISIVREWAESSSRDLYDRAVRRAALAKTGTPQTGGNSCKSFTEIGLENICATFEDSGLKPLINNKNAQTRLYGLDEKREVAHALGLPTYNTLYSFMLLLVNEHPDITSTYLTRLMLYNERGRLVGFTKSGHGYQLQGYKRRKGNKKAEQKIQLSDKAANLVSQVIDITNPLRDYLKSINNDNWRYLFLTCGSAFSKPSIAKVPSWSKSTFESIRSVKSAHAELSILFNKYDRPNSEKDVLKFMDMVSLRSMRSSRGVEIYIDTQSVDIMARALGHAKYNTDLLSRYLPESILAFFQTRWIRIFQKAFICEAMKDSPHLLRATKFETMNELHEFLSNHALKDIPRHLSNPDNTRAKEDQNNGHVLISVDVGILTALISLEQAVKSSESPDLVNGLAKYWSQVSQHITSEISNGDDPLLTEHLETARMHADPNRMGGMIYDSAC